MANLLSQAEIHFLALRNSWFFDLDLKDHSDSCVFTGQGVADLNRISGVMLRNPKGKFLVNVGMDFSQYKPFNLDDISGIRNAFVAFYGNVNKPQLPEDEIKPAGINLRDPTHEFTNPHGLG